MVSKSIYKTLEHSQEKRELKSISTTLYPQKSTIYFKKMKDDSQDEFELESQWQSLELLKQNYPSRDYCSVFAFAYKKQTKDTTLVCPQEEVIYFNPQRLLGFYGQLAQDVDKNSLKAIKSSAKPYQTMIVWSDPNGYASIGADDIKMTLRRITKVGSIK